MDRETLEKEINKRIWFHSIEVAPGLWTAGHYRPDSKWLFNLMELPEDMKGLRCLDLGCADGAHAFEMARRGADVTAVDLFSPDFRNVEFLGKVFDLPVKYIQSSIYELKTEPYDIILALGVLYHLQHPVLGLQCLNKLCRDTLVLESHIAKGWGMTCKFFPSNELDGDPSNWWDPTKKCLLAMVKSSGFEVVKSLSQAKKRFMLKAKKVKDVHPALNYNDVYMANYGHLPY